MALGLVCAMWPAVLHEKGERDMGLKMNAREMDGRTMEKIRLRAKLGSIVHALSAHDQLEMHSNTTNHQHERHDMLSIKGNLRSVINSTIAVRMLLLHCPSPQPCCFEGR